MNRFLPLSRGLDFRSGGVKILLGRVSGTLHPGREELNESVAAIHASGLQAVIHAIEEPEIEAACDAIACALRRHPRPDHRHRIEHCSVCPPNLLRRIADLGITIVTQPAFIHLSGDRYLKTVSRDQRAHLYAIGSMIGCGLRVGFSSDCPISDVNPMVGIQAAVTRMTEDGTVLLPQERVSVSDALLAYTLDAAAANFEDGIKGSITRGKTCRFGDAERRSAHSKSGRHQRHPSHHDDAGRPNSLERSRIFIIGDEEARVMNRSNHVGRGFSPDALEILFSRNASGLKPDPHDLAVLPSLQNAFFQHRLKFRLRTPEQFNKYIMVILAQFGRGSPGFVFFILGPQGGAVCEPCSRISGARGG